MNLDFFFWLFEKNGSVGRWETKQFHWDGLRTWEKTKITGFPRDLTWNVLLYFYSNKRITGANQNCRFGTYKNTNLILKTTKWMINKVLSLYYLNLFPLLATVSLLGQLWKSFLFSLRLHDCVDVFIHEKENWQWTFFPPSVTPLSLAVMYPERGTVVAQIYHNRDTFDFSQGHVTKNQPMAVPV